MRLAAEHVNRGFDVEGDELVIIPEATLEREYGWVFFYDSRRHVETDDFRYALAGNGPVLVEKDDGSVHEFGTARPVEWFLEEYEARRRAGGRTQK